MWVTVGVGIIKVFVFIYDVLTYPIYLLVQKPWKIKHLAQKQRAKMFKVDDGIVYRNLDKPTELSLKFTQEGIDTMKKVFSYAANKNPSHRCLGTRVVLAEEDEKQPNGRIFKKFVMGDYKWKTVRQVEEEALSIGRGLVELGQKPKENIVIFAETRAEWLITTFGCFTQNIPVVTLYATLGEEALIHGINETEVKIVLTSHELLPKFKSILEQTPMVKHIIVMEDSLKKTETRGYKEDVTITMYRDLLQKGRESTAGTSQVSPEDTAVIMYTSGSTGLPKGVVMSHFNLVTALKSFTGVIKIHESDVCIGYLPLAHVLELLCECMCIVNGVSIGYSSALTMTDKSSKIKNGSKGDATVLKPTLMAAVPLILDRIYKNIQENVNAGGEFSKAMFSFAMKYKLGWLKSGFDTPILNRIVFSKVQQLLGGKIREMYVGGAALAPDTQDNMRACLNVPVMQGYSLTEVSACTSISDEHDTSVGRVGAPLVSCDVKLINWEEGSYYITDKPYPRGEIVIGGDSVTKGYYKMPEKTAEDYMEVDGKRWFKTGDIGEFHDDGVLKIIDRKKDLVKLQFGEYVSLGKVEAELKTNCLVENICIYGESSKTFTVALVVPLYKPLMALATKLGSNGMGFDELCADKTVEQAVLKELQEHGKRCGLQKFEIPEAIRLCSEVWTPDMGLVTAAFKLKRKSIQDHYQSDINRMYAS